ncbi:hypothetical protein Goshw_005727 [Gossypium schwendimanii]|uniref:Uncharacterized protein n=1 Tax=Gossypium schwendimanii TaxID=34291 RepID=A0A7J9N0F9_GOSSC|nr:hypothetical protein [Gossypium schwendimanii]
MIKGSTIISWCQIQKLLDL